jgi:hypothetical protein
MTSSEAVSSLVRIILLALATSVALTGCIHASIPSAADQARQAAAIERAFWTFSDLGVVSWEDTSVCRQIRYERGYFMDDDPSGRCSDSEAAPFDDAATADLVRVGEVLDEAGASVQRLYVTYADGNVESGTFHVPGGAFDSFTLYFGRDGIPPLDWDADATATAQINEQWWFANEDWN